MIGDPIAHSASPALHRAFLADARRSGTYEALRVPAGSCSGELDRLHAAGFHGVNVTTPLKEEAFAYCVVHDAAAAISRSVNTVVFEGRGAAGYNTDGAGALGALQDVLGNDAIAGRSILILGAGPTARAAALALRDAGARIFVWNRTYARGQAVVQRLGVASWRSDVAYDAVLSTLTPHSRLADDDLIRTIVSAPAVVDANYGPRATLASTLGRPVVDGHAMLRASARASFALFTA